MSTPILAPTTKTVKIVGGEALWSNELSLKINQPRSKNTPTISLPTNLSAQAYFIAHLPPEFFQEGVIWFLPSHREIYEAKEILKFWLSTLKQHLAEIPNLLEFPDDFITWLALNRQQQSNILLVAQEHLDLALPSPQTIETHTLTLETGHTIKPLALLNKLTQAGFEPGPLMQDSGWYQKRGETVIVSTPGAQWRLRWHKDTLEKIEEISLATLTTIAIKEKITILPVRLPAQASKSLINHVTPQHSLICPPANLWPRHHRVYNTDIKGDKIFENIPLFAKQWPELERWWQNKINNGNKIIIVTEHPYRLSSFLNESIGTPTVFETPLSVSPILAGFTNKLSGVNLITDRELYGPRRPHKRVGLAAYEKLKFGDYLVHIDHGIGKFTGLTQKLIDQQTREYFVIEYADNDKLFVPIEHTDRLSRYLGSPNPKLEKLSSAHWFKVQKKVKAETAQLARELLNIYAQRHLAETTPWQSFPEENLIAQDFPYPLTPDQLKTWAEIQADLTSPKPMDRLICGDVGFGKTELAIRTSGRAVFNGYQTAVLVPTTILAQQHFDTFTARLKDYGVRLSLVSRAQTATTIKQTLKELAEGKIDIIIGTHRLLAKDVRFRRLGLLVIDEEQRFGVKQKEQLRGLKPSVHTLALSATPIPRTLHLAVSNLRDLSIILSPPQGRQAVNMGFGPRHDDTIKQAVAAELHRQGQIYYLVPRVKDIPAAEARLKKLFPHIKLGIVHGQKPPRAVAETMHRFDQGEINLLLATSIIENGLDLPNVNTLIVDEAQNFGLADLYQLKGRVGRGAAKAYAYFLTSGKKSISTEKRLAALADTEELGGGLSLALRDLELRGAGAILGREQHGQVTAVGLHLYGQMLAEAIEEQRTGQTLPAIPEVKLNLPLEGRILPELAPDEEKRIHIYQRLASVREPTELLPTAINLLGRPLADDKADMLFKNLLTLLEIKLLAEQARLQEVACWPKDKQGQFILRPLSALPAEAVSRLTNFDNTWHQVESAWQALRPLAAGAWLPWLKESLKLIQN